ncbi:unnamed protein product, partial [Pylaiella littoralis]
SIVIRVGVRLHCSSRFERLCTTPPFVSLSITFPTVAFPCTFAQVTQADLNAYPRMLVVCGILFAAIPCVYRILSFLHSPISLNTHRAYVL